MREIRRERVPVIDPEHRGKRREQEIDVKLGGRGGHQPGKADAPRQQNDAERELCGIHRVGNDTLCLIVERQPERQRARIEPRQIRKIH
jgi:hypothetical protein